MSTYATVKLDPFGVVKDLNPYDTPDNVYTDARNMRFKNGRAIKFKGESEGTTTTAQATHLQFNGNHVSPYWLYFGDGIARVTNFSVDKDIEGTALSSTTDWDSCLFNGLPICNNTLDTPRYWDNDFATPGTLANLPAFPANTTCQALRPFRSFLVALNTTVSATEQPNRLIWSDASDAGALPASWDITDPTVLAGDAYLTDERAVIIDGAQLRDFFVIYKTHSTYLMRFVGGQTVMAIDKVQVNSGLLAKNCVTEFMGKHFVVSDGDIVLFDGQNITSIANQRVRREIFGNIDGTYFDNSFVVRHDTQKEIWVCYPESGEEYASKAAVWNWEEDSWSFRDLTDTKHISTGVAIISYATYDATTTTYAANTQVYNSNASNPTIDAVISAKTLALNVIDDTNDIDGQAMPTRLSKEGMDFGEPDLVKVVKAVKPQVTASVGTRIYISVGTQLNPDDNITWSSEALYTVGTDREAHFTEKGRFISVRMRTQDTGVDWKCHGFTIDLAQSGKY